MLHFGNLLQYYYTFKKFQFFCSLKNFLQSRFEEISPRCVFFSSVSLSLSVCLSVCLSVSLSLSLLILSFSKPAGMLIATVLGLVEPLTKISTSPYRAK